MNQPLTRLPLKGQSKPEDFEVYTQTAAFKLYTGQVQSRQL